MPLYIALSRSFINIFREYNIKVVITRDKVHAMCIWFALHRSELKVHKN